MTKEEFVLKLLQEGRPYLEVVAVLITYHLPQPKYMKKKDADVDGSKPDPK